MEKYLWSDNPIKLQRAIADAKDKNNEAEVKELYVSYGGKLIGLPEVKEEPKMEEEKELEPVVESPTPVEEVVIEETPEEVEVPVEEPKVSSDDETI